MWTTRVWPSGAIRCDCHAYPVGMATSSVLLHTLNCSLLRSAGAFFRKQIRHFPKAVTHTSRRYSGNRRCSLQALPTSMDDSVFQAVTALHDSPCRAAIFVTGGGFQGVSWLLTVPGASRTVLDVRIPYANASLAEILGRTPDQYASRVTAVDMAQAAYKHAAAIAPFGTELVGVSLTCALATDRTKQGEHTAFAAAHNGQSTQMFSLQLVKGRRDRAAEDQVASRLLLHVLSCVSLPAGSKLLQLGTEADEELQESRESLDDPLAALLEGHLSTVEYCSDQTVIAAPRPGRIYLPGSFNPLHHGHRSLLAAACALEGRSHQDGCFELSAGNPDKGTLPIETVRERIRQFQDAGLPIVITQAPLYTLKARLFPQSTFVVGYDTAIRLVDPKYYGGETQMLLQFAELAHLGCKFLVAGRIGDDKRFMKLSDVKVPRDLAGMNLFKDIPEELFRSDVSSTEIRDTQGAN